MLDNAWLNHFYLNFVAIVPKGFSMRDIPDENKPKCRRPKIDQMETAYERKETNMLIDLYGISVKSG